MAASLSDNLIITRAPPVGAFAFRRYDRGIREGALHQYPCHIVDLFLLLEMKVNNNVDMISINAYYNNMFNRMEEW